MLLGRQPRPGSPDALTGGPVDGDYYGSAAGTRCGHALRGLVQGTRCGGLAQGTRCAVPARARISFHSLPRRSLSLSLSLSLCLSLSLSLLLGAGQLLGVNTAIRYWESLLRLGEGDLAAG